MLVRSHRLMAVIACMAGAIFVAECAELSGVSGEKVRFTGVALVAENSAGSYGGIILELASQGYGLPLEGPWLPPVQGQQLPEGFRAWATALTADDAALIYIFADNDGPTYETFPLQKVAEIVNRLPCQYLFVVIDLPTRRWPYGDITPDALVAARQRYELFHKGFVVFTSGPLERRLMRKDMQYSSFFYYLWRGLLDGFADSDSDGVITLWEGYEYAFWCTYAHSIATSGRPQTPLYTHLEQWPTQPILVERTGGYENAPDPLLVQCAAASRRTPIRLRGIMAPAGPMGPTGVMGPRGPSWMSWFQGPTPTDTQPGRMAAWIGQNLRLLQEKVAWLEESAEALQVVGTVPSRRPPAPEHKDSGIVLGLARAYVLRYRPGPAGPAAQHSEAALQAREAVIAQIADGEKRDRAVENDRLLEELGELAQTLELRAMARWAWLKHYYQYMTPSPTGPGFCRTPVTWPQTLPAPPSDRGGPSGPQGSRGKVPPDAQLELVGEQSVSLSSAELTNNLRLLEERLKVIADYY